MEIVRLHGGIPRSNLALGEPPNAARTAEESEETIRSPIEEREEVDATDIQAGQVGIVQAGRVLEIRVQAGLEAQFGHVHNFRRRKKVGEKVGEKAEN